MDDPVLSYGFLERRAITAIFCQADSLGIHTVGAVQGV